MSLVALCGMDKKISDTIYLQSYFEEQYEFWYTSKPKERQLIEDIVIKFVDNTLADTIYLQVNNGLASGLCSYPHFEEDLKKIIILLRKIKRK